MCIALPMFTNESIDWKLRSYKIPPTGTPLPPSPPPKIWETFSSKPFGRKS